MNLFIHVSKYFNYEKENIKFYCNTFFSLVDKFNFKFDNSDLVFESVLDAGIDIIDLESEDGEVVITAKKPGLVIGKYGVNRFLRCQGYFLNSIKMR